MRPVLFCVPTIVFASFCTAQQFQDATSARFPSQSYYSNQASVCDIDNDGDLDIVFADGQGYSSQGSALRPRIYINDGTGYFTDETIARSGGVTGWFRGVEFGDIDRDGDWDMVLANDFYETPLLLKNDGTGHFTYTASLLPTAALSSARAQFGDIDNDGDLDLAFCHSGTSSRFGSNGAPRIYRNDGSGRYSDITSSHTPNVIIRDQQDVIFADVDGDLDLDLHIGSRSSVSGGSKLYINDGTGSFTDSGALPTDYSCYSYDFGDIDGDGDLDLLGANSWSSNREMLLRNDHDGTTWVNISSGISPNPTSDDNDTKFLDFDMDGDLDFVVATLFASQERFYRNNGDNTFTQVTNMASSVNDSSLDVVIADVTGDGAYDMITAQGESGNFQNRIYVNTGPTDNLPPNVVKTEQVSPADGEIGDFVVRTVVYDQHTSDRGFHPQSMEIYWSLNGAQMDPIEMEWSGNSLWRGVFPDIPACATVNYEVLAIDRAGNSGSGDSSSFQTTGSCGTTGDLNGDGAVDGADIGLFLLQWYCSKCEADFNGDGIVDGADFGILLLAWTG